MSFEYFEADSHVTTYDKFRPCPPKELIDRIAEFASEKIEPLQLAVDIGCGSGQSTQILAPHFKEVLGLDPSGSIINAAQKRCRCPNVSFQTSSAEHLNLKDHSVNVVTSCQAIHWFDLSKFYPEVNRVLSPNGVLAIYGYHLPEPIFDGKDEQLAAVIKKYYLEVLGDYVLPESKKVYLDNYRAREYNVIPFLVGGKMVREEGFTIEVDVDISDITGYITSWSAFQNYVKQKGEEEGQKVAKLFENEFRNVSGISESKSTKLKIVFRYFLLLGRKEEQK